MVAALELLCLLCLYRSDEVTFEAQNWLSFTTEFPPLTEFWSLLHYRTCFWGVNNIGLNSRLQLISKYRVIVGVSHFSRIAYWETAKNMLVVTDEILCCGIHINIQASLNLLFWDGSARQTMTRVSAKDLKQRIYLMFIYCFSGPIFRKLWFRNRTRTFLGTRIYNIPVNVAPLNRDPL